MKAGVSFYLFILVLIFSRNSWSAEPSCQLDNKVSGKQFRIFNALLYENTPDLKEHCIEDINVLYAWRFFPRGNKHGDLTLPGQKSLYKLVSELRGTETITVIDIEHWPLKNKPQDTIKESVNNYVYTLSFLKEYLPDIKFGYYGVVPTKDFSRAKQMPDNPAYIDWQNQNNNVKNVASLVDATFPSLYTINPVHKEWINRAAAQIRESHRLAPDKPVFPFIWPNYHEQGGRYPCCVELSPDYWRKQLDFLRDHSDGLVLWGGYKQQWNEESKWWQETLDYIESSFNKTPL